MPLPSAFLLGLMEAFVTSANSLGLVKLAAASAAFWAARERDTTGMLERERVSCWDSASALFKPFLCRWHAFSNCATVLRLFKSPRLVRSESICTCDLQSAGSEDFRLSRADPGPRRQGITGRRPVEQPLTLKSMTVTLRRCGILSSVTIKSMTVTLRRCTQRLGPGC